MQAEEWATAFKPVDEFGKPIAPERLPLMISLSQKRPAYQKFSIRGLDGIFRRLEVTSFPLTGLNGELLGAAALFWELPE